MKLKNKLLPVFGGLTATVAVVTPLATSCSEWVRYTDMLHEYKPGVRPYEEIVFHDIMDVDELYWARFSKNTDILRDDVLWSLSKTICYAMSQESGVLKDTFKTINTYNFDLFIDEVIQDDEDTPDTDESAVNFTIIWDFCAEYNTAKRPHIGDKYIDIIDAHMTFKTVDPWKLVVLNADADEHLDGEWAMELQQPTDVKFPGKENIKGLVCIKTDSSYRYSENEERAGDKWDSVSEHVETRDISWAIGQPYSGMEYMSKYMLTLLDEHFTGTHLLPFASHYLTNVELR